MAALETLIADDERLMKRALFTLAEAMESSARTIDRQGRPKIDARISKLKVSAALGIVNLFQLAKHPLNWHRLLFGRDDDSGPSGAPDGQPDRPDAGSGAGAVQRRQVG